MEMFELQTTNDSQRTVYIVGRWDFENTRLWISPPPPPTQSGNASVLAISVCKVCFLIIARRFIFTFAFISFSILGGLFARF